MYICMCVYIKYIFILDCSVFFKIIRYIFIKIEIRVIYCWKIVTHKNIIIVTIIYINVFENELYSISEKLYFMLIEYFTYKFKKKFILY